MSKRPLASGLPAKPITTPTQVSTKLPPPSSTRSAPPRPPRVNNNSHINQPGLAPPLPAGPPPPLLNVNGNGPYGVGPQAFPGAIPPQQYQQQQQQQAGAMSYQQQQPGQVDPAAHAAAWAAYYAAQGQPNPYAPAAGAVTPNPPGAGGANTAYANYGYGMGTAHGNHVNPQQQPQAPQPQQPPYGAPGYQYPAPAGPTPPPYRPPGAGPVPPPQQYGGAGYQQQQQQQQPGQYYPQPQPQQGPPNGNFRPPQGQPQVPGYGSPAAPMPMAGPYQVQPGQPPLPQQPPPNQPYFPGNQYNQQSPATQAAPMAGYQAGPGGQGQGFRPSGPGPQGQAQNRPYSPRPPAGQGMGMQGGMNMGPPNGMMGMNAGTPPAKRPRFDNPVRPGMGMGMNNARPPSAAPGAYSAGRPPQGISGPTGPSAPARPPIVRPPIHLGMGGPPPPGMGITPRAVNPVSANAITVPRPGMRGRDRPSHNPSHSHAPARAPPAKAPVVNVPGAPRGPSGKSGLRASIRDAAGLSGFGGKRSAAADERERERKKRDRERDTRDNDRESVNGNVKATMTDFRIVGMEMKDVEGAVWKWGLTGEEATKLHPPPAPAAPKGADKQGEVKQEDGKKEEEVKVEEQGDAEVKDEADEADAADAAGLAPGAPALERSASGDEEERSRKRKADSPDEEESQEGSHKKRAAHEHKDDAAVEASTDTAEPTAVDASATAAADVAVKSEETEVQAATAHEDKPSDAAASTETKDPTEAKAETEAEKKAPRSKYEENQNRFRIYFESPAELDRIPKALRRGNKRWRRESTAPRTGTPTPAAAPAPVSATIAESAAAPAEVVETVEVIAEVPEPVGEADGAANGEAVSEQAEEVAAQVPAELVVDQLAAVAEEAAAAAVEPAVAAEVDAEEQEHVGDISMSSNSGPAVDEEAAVEAEVGDAVAADEAANVDAVVSGDAAEADPAAAQIAADADGAAPAEPAAEVPAIVAESEADARERERVEREAEEAKYLQHQPSTNRISILYEESSRRICLDADIVSKVRVYREEGRIEVDFVQAEAEQGGEEEESGDRRKGVLVEVYDNTDERFVPLSNTRLDEIHSAPKTDEEEAEEKVEGQDEPAEDRSTVPPLHKPTSTLTVWLNKRRPLSEPKWLRSNNADEWLYELFGPAIKSSSSSLSAATASPEALEAWRGKLEVVDPDPVPTLRDILAQWASSCSMGKFADRSTFTSSLLADPADLLEILLRLARGDRNPSIGGGNASGFGALASGIRHDSPYASHQTHVSLAVLQMYRLTMAYAKKAMDTQGEEEVKEKMEDIVKSLPVGMIQKSLDGLFREWGEKKA